MTNILLLTSSPRGDQSVSTKIAQAVVREIERSHLRTKLVVRDLASTPPSHIDVAYVVGRNIQETQRTPEQAQAVAAAEELVSELIATDIIVIGSAMINFGISSTLKSWLDHVLLPGSTFTYVDGSPKGLTTGKTVVLVMARGGIYLEGPMKIFDFQEPYLRATLGIMGITDLRVLSVEGTALSPETAEVAVSGAIARVQELVQSI